MKVQPCSSCGARYNVERLPDGSKFECRRCGQMVHLTETARPPARFALGLLISGALTLVGLLLYANPQFGFAETRWPWELVGGAEPWSTQITVLLWTVVGVWTLVTSLGIAAPSRSLLTAALAGMLVLMCTSGAVPVLHTTWPLQFLLAFIALGTGLLLTEHAGAGGIARGLAFTGGLMIVWPYVIPFPGSSDVQVVVMVRSLEAVFDGTLGAEAALRVMVPPWTLLLTGIVGLIAGLGARGTFVVWMGWSLGCATLLLPTAADIVSVWDAPGLTLGQRIALHGTSALVTSGLILWVLSANAAADLVRHRKETS